MTLALYSDGGVILKNPSPYGGVWAWCLVQNNRIIRHDSSVLYAQYITNNHMELYAAVRALEDTRKNPVPLWTDSLVTQLRLTGGTKKFAGIPEELRRRTLKLVAKRPRVLLLAGHPTKKDLECGYKSKPIGKLPVSRWNVWCDNQCRRLANLPGVCPS